MALTRTSLAAAAATILVGTGMVAGAGAAQATTPVTSYVPGSSIATDDANYNVWHFGQNEDGGYHNYVKRDARNGMVLDGYSTYQVLKGNGNSNRVIDDKNDIHELATSLGFTMSGSSRVYYQVPVYYDSIAGGNGYTILRAPVTAPGGNWTTEFGIEGTSYVAGASASLKALTDALEAKPNARPIGAGFLVDDPSDQVLIQSFKAGNELTYFHVKPDHAPVSFTDITASTKFAQEINWMAAASISTGVKQPNGTYKYVPKRQVTREAMAAFLYRLNPPTNYEEPKVSPFADVKPGDPFYKEIAWMSDYKLSTGIAQPSGKPRYAPKANITREAMAAFMYRMDESRKPDSPAISPFADVFIESKFYKEIAWMHQSELSTGIAQPSGRPNYAPKAGTTREAMAAFLYRAEH